MTRDERLLAAVYWLAALAVWPFGDFPLNDDWAYGEPVRRWLAGGGLRLGETGAPTLLGHSAWGALFCLPAGFSHGALRLSTLALVFAGVLCFRRSLLRLGASSRAALAGSLVLALNPLGFMLGASYMTDGPALAWMLLAAHAYLVGVEDRRPGWVWAGSACAAAAYLVRQTGFCVPLATALILALRGERGPRAYGRALALPLAALAAHALWLKTVGPTAAMRDYAWAATLAHVSDPRRLALDALARFTGATLYLGVFLLPFAPAASAGAWEAWRKRKLPLAALAALWAAALVLGVAPATGNTIGRFGLGVCSLAACELKRSGWLGASAFWLLLPAAAAASLAALAARLPARSAWRGGLGLYAAGFVAAFGLSLAGRDYFDRYYLVLLPPAIAAAALAVPASWASLAPGLVFLGAWSILGTGDYLRWNAAKWEGARALAAQGLDPRDIFAGIEWDGVHGAIAAGDRSYRAWVTFAPASTDPRLERVGEAPYFSPLTLHRERLYLWRDAR